MRGARLEACGPEGFREPRRMIGGSASRSKATVATVACGCRSLLRMHGGLLSHPGRIGIHRQLAIDIHHAPSAREIRPFRTPLISLSIRAVNGPVAQNRTLAAFAISVDTLPSFPGGVLGRAHPRAATAPLVHGSLPKGTGRRYPGSRRHGRVTCGGSRAHSPGYEPDPAVHLPHLSQRGTLDAISTARSHHPSAPPIPKRSSPHAEPSRMPRYAAPFMQPVRRGV